MANMIDVKDKIVSVEGLAELHNYNENNYANKSNTVFWREVEDDEDEENNAPIKVLSGAEVCSFLGISNS